jgi:hypothetical protein
MQQIQGIIASHTLEPLGKPALIVQLSEQMSLGAGQFVMAYHPGEEDPVRSRIFPIEFSPDGFTSDHIPGPAWLPGQSVDILGPLGNSFAPPREARNWFLLSLGHHPERLRPLLASGVEQSASVAFWSNRQIPPLPADVERPVAPVDALAWADFIAIELPGLGWPEDYLSLRTQLMDRRTAHIQALVDVPTPCGLGACQACAIPQRGKWIFGCQSGLVRALEEISV